MISHPATGARLLPAFLIGLLLLGGAQAQVAAPLPAGVAEQIEALQEEKAARTPAQRKMDSTLIYAVKKSRGQRIGAGVAALEAGVKVEADAAALVDIRAVVSPELLAALKAAGATVVSSVPRFEAIRARVPLAALEGLAGRADVKFIKPAAQARTRTGPLNSQGDVAHGAAAARTTFGVSGAGVTVGVISDSIDFLEASQASGELGPVTALPGQDPRGFSGEGTAMLEIVHDLAPAARLLFATAFLSEAGFAQNILDLRSAGADIIVDDVFYFDESPFQDGPVAQAVEQVSADGALYFSAAGNEGNKNKGTSGTWEGDFLDGGATGAPITKAGRVHNFGGQNFNSLTASGGTVALFWSDPLGASSNDYDLYVLNAAGTAVVQAGTTTQNGTQDPLELIQAPNDGDRIVVVKAAAAASRFLHLSTFRGRLSLSTAGTMAGHSSTASAIGVAAVSANAGGVFSTGNPVESFSSDGPRRVFYNSDGTAITAALGATGGRLLNKPDIAAADGVRTSVPGFAAFFGTSAAAPHAAAIAALLLSQDLTLTAAKVREALTIMALDIEGPGRDRDSGLGIIRPGPALQTLDAGLKAQIITSAGVALTAESFTPANATPDPGERVTVSLTLRNAGLGATGNLTATLLETGGVSGPTGPQVFGAVAPAATAARPFAFEANGPCGGKITLTFALADGAIDYGTVTASFRLGTLGAAQSFSNAAAITIADNAPATPFPSVINVAGFSGRVGKATVTLRGFSHTFPADLDMLLVSPSGKAVVLMSQAGGGDDVTNLTFTFDDDAAGGVPTPIVTGSYRPTDAAPGDLLPPAPAGPYPTELATLAGTEANGQWRLFVQDSFAIDVGAIAQGWTLTLRSAQCATGGPGADLAVALSASAEVVAVGGALIYTATVFNNGPASATNVTLTDTLPAGVSFASATATQGTVARTGATVTASLGVIPSYGAATVRITTTAAASGPLTHTASVTTTSAENNAGNNNASLAVNAGVPNLAALQPPGWSGALVVSNVAGTNSDTTLAPTNSVFVDFAFTNTGSAPAPAEFIARLEVDGVLRRTFERQLAMEPGGQFIMEDIALPPLAAGMHTIRITLDAGGAVAEGNEADNVLVKQVLSNARPTISNIFGVTTNEDTATAPIGFTIGDAENGPNGLALAVQTSNPALLPLANIVLGGAGATRTVTLTPARDLSGQAVVTLTVTDSEGITADESFALTVRAVNDAPTLDALPAVTVLEDAGVQTIALTGIGAGAANETQALAITATSSDPAFIAHPAISYASGSATGSLAFQSAPSASGTATITVTVDDGGAENRTRTRTFLVTVASVNDRPIFTKGPDVAAHEDAGAQTIPGWASGISAGPANESGQTVGFSVEAANPALFAAGPGVAADGTLSFTAAPNANGTSLVTVRLADNGGGANTSEAQTFLIVVNAVNDAPSFVKGANQTVNEDSGARTDASWARNLSRGPANEGAQTLEFLTTSDAPELFAAPPTVAANGALTFTPAANRAGVATVTVRLCDGGGTENGGTEVSAPQTFTVTVAAVNDAPSFTPGPDVTLAEDAGPQTLAWAAGISAGGPDEGGQALTFAVGNDRAALFSAAPRIGADGTLTFTPAPNANGTAQVTVRLRDDGGTARGGQNVGGETTFRIQVNAVNDAPTLAAPGGVIFDEDAPARTVALTGLGSGAADETDALTVTATSSDPALVPHPAVTYANPNASGSLALAPAANAHGTATITVTVDDGLEQAARTFAVTVNAVNDAPTLDALAPLTISEDAPMQSVALTGLSTGAVNEADALTITATSSNPALIPNPAVVYASGEAIGALRFTPQADAHGVATITVVVNDGQAANAVATRTLNVTVSAVNDAPTLGALGDLSLLENAAAQVVPLAGIGSGAANEADAVTITATSSNPALLPHPTVSYSSGSAIGSVSFQPAADANGAATVTVTASDGQATATRSFTVTIRAVNDAPSFALPGAEERVNEDSGPRVVAAFASVITAGPADESGQSVEFVVAADNAALFSAAPAISAAGELTFTPAANAHGSAVVTATLRDNGGTEDRGSDASEARTFTITVEPVNDAPSFAKGANQAVRQNGGPQVAPGWATAISAGPDDESAQTFVFLVENDRAALFATPPAIAPDGTLTFTPAADASGTATVTVRLRDSGGTERGGVEVSAAQTFTIGTTAVNDAPSFVAGADQSAAQDAGPLSVPGWATAISAGPADEAGQAVTFLVNTDVPALFTAPPAVAPDGTLTFTPAPTASGTATVTVQLRDDGGVSTSGVDTSAAQTFRIAVTTFVEELGTYHGLARAADGAPLGQERTGLLRLTVARRGLFTGRLTLGGAAHRLAGRIDKAGVARFGRASTAEFPLGRGRLLTLRVDVGAGTDKLTGAITENGAAFAAIEADRALYTAAAQPVAPFRNVPADLLGAYTVLLAARTPEEQGRSAHAFPRGDGIALLRVGRNGVARIAGTLADGAPFTSANALSKANAWPLHAALPRGLGTISGPVIFRDRAGVSDADGLGLLWFKPANRGRTFYPEGWAAGIRLDVLGSKFIPPAPGQSALPGLSAPDADGNAEFAATAGNVPGGGITQRVNLGASAAVAVVAPAADRLALTVAGPTGSFRGTFIHPATFRRVSFRGVIFQKQALGAGFFLGVNQSGAVEIAPREEPAGVEQ